MDVEIISKETIKPSSPTCHKSKNFKVSFLDQLAPSSYIPLLLFYKLPTISNASELLINLKKSFPETLTLFYPLAGRLKDDSVCIDCNDEGALYVEARVDCTLSQFLQVPDFALLNKFLPCHANSLDKDFETLLAIQVTRFECGGIVIGACVLHKVVDMSTLSNFLKSWGKIAGGLTDQVVKPDLYSSSSLFPPRDSLTSDFMKNFENFYFRGLKKSNNIKRFVFNEKAIANIKDEAASESVPHPSRVVALTAFICKRIMEAHSAQQTAPHVWMITHAVNLRGRVEPPLPNYSFGNLVWLAYEFVDESETQTEVPNLAEMVKEMFVNVSSENLQGLDLEDMLTSLDDVIGNVSKIQNLKILRFTSWCNFGLYNINFGWGGPVWISGMGDTLGYHSKQHFLFMDSKCGKQIEVWMDLDEQYISLLQNHPHFLAYAIPNPSVICME